MEARAAEVLAPPRLIGLANASIDISDGLVADLRHVCDVSGLSAVVEAEAVPLSPPARAAVARDPALLATALTGGDDYEILFTAPSGVTASLARVAQACGVPITAIGRMEKAVAGATPAVTLIDGNGHPLTIGRGGWSHF